MNLLLFAEGFKRISFPFTADVSIKNMQPGGPNEMLKLWSGDHDKTVFMTLL